MSLGDTDFVPAPWLRGPHAQTLGGRALRAPAPSPYVRRERLELTDGDFVDLDFAPPAGGLPAPFAVLLHGLEGSSASGYMRIAAAALAGRGIEVVSLNFRGCSGEANRLLRSYHSGETADVKAVLDHLRRARPKAPHALIGFSLGGNVALKYLGECGDAASDDLATAVAVSVPFDLEASAVKLETGMGRLYTRHFLHSMVRKAARRARRFQNTLDAAAIRRCRTLHAFDELVTAPVHGFRDASDYYRRCSSNAFLTRIRVPTLILQALDDPFIPRPSVPESEIRRNTVLRAVFTQAGGHLGFVAGRWPLRHRFWAEERIADEVARAIRGTAATLATGSADVRPAFSE